MVIEKQALPIQIFLALHPFWLLEEIALHKIRVSGTLLMIPIVKESPTNPGHA